MNTIVTFEPLGIFQFCFQIWNPWENLHKIGYFITLKSKK